MSNNCILLCGLPNSGKTTFIAALWYLLYNGEVDTSIAYSSLPEKRDYLCGLSDKWSSLHKISHTPTGEIQDISIPLTVNSVETVLNIPDMSGETWKNIWISRSCSRFTVEWCTSSSSILLFIHSDDIRVPIDILTANTMAASVAEESNAEADRETVEVEWDPAKAPTQVMLVDILQSISREPLGVPNKKLAIVLSAWDKVTDNGMSPENYLQTYLPLLYQYLSCGAHFKSIKIFGVSAQGGDIDTNEQKDVLRIIDKPSERILVVDEEISSHDLTLPIKWLISE